METNNTIEYVTDNLDSDLYGHYKGYPLWKTVYTKKLDGYDKVSYWFSDSEGFEICSFDTEEEMLTYIDNFKEV